MLRKPRGRRSKSTSVCPLSQAPFYTAWETSATHIVSSLQAPVIGDVLPQGLESVEPLSVDLVLVVLFFHTGCVILESRQ